ncbi:hypothetical protein Micbo1qcDRAFT_13016 [Microdochium bolleyi]|uniref:Mid2 domain-containing protein n=1 Tax=Microdochium bolleyi TaxID=196109 RepID=A0A136IX64_9PEZI|nr:hypothetical protein Micbo1qcDRAFT_13016 [Microdochium bolleyi]
MASADAQSWVYPPPGVDVPPVAATSNFGPVNFGDSMILAWDAATSPTVIFSCFSQLGNQTAAYAVRGKKSPATYKFTETALQQSSFDLTFCHFYFDPSLHGNTVVFQYDNKPLAKPVTWSAGAATASSSTKSSSSSTSTATSSTTTASTTNGLSSPTVSLPAPTTPTPTDAGPASAQGSSSGGGLSAGASAGIGVGVGLGVIGAAAVAAFFLVRRRRRSRKQALAPPTDQPGPYEVPGSMQQPYTDGGGGTSPYYSSQQGTPKTTYHDSMYHQQPAAAPAAPAELQGGHRPTELP